VDARDRDRRRRAIARTVALALRERDFRSTLKLTDDEGRHPFLALLPDDPMSIVFAELADLAGQAYLVIEGTDRLEFVSMTRVTTDADLQACAPDGPCPIHPNSTVGLVFDYLKVVRRPLLCHEAKPDEVQLELVDAPGPDVPALC
jgi:hypothetical protein